MGVPLIQQVTVARYLLGKKLKGEKRYPLVLMLEPLFQCNLECAGCGKIDYEKDILKQRVSVENRQNGQRTELRFEAIEPSAKFDAALLTESGLARGP